MKILIVDDEKLIVDDLTRDLKELYPNAVINGKTSAAEALAEAESTTFDVALLDIAMPDMDGLTLARKLIASSPEINIIFVTGHSDFALEAHELYCSAFLVKPVGTRKLQKAFMNLRKPFIDLPPDFSMSYYSGNAVIGKRLELYREQRGLSRQKIADLKNVSRQTVYRWEHGERVPELLTLIKLARILGVRVEDLIERL